MPYFEMAPLPGRLLAAADDLVCTATGCKRLFTQKTMHYRVILRRIAGPLNRGSLIEAVANRGVYGLVGAFTD